MTEISEKTLQGTQIELAKACEELEKLRAATQNGSDEAAEGLTSETERLRDELHKTMDDAIVARGEAQRLRDEVAHAADDGQKLKNEVHALREELRLSKRNADHLTSEIQVKESGIFYIA